MPDALIERVLALSARLAHLGVWPDLAAIPVADLWGLYCFLRRAAQEG